MPPTYSECALRSLGVFGLTTDDAATDDRDRETQAARHAREIDLALCPGGLAVITGPSGIGKSSILRALAMRLRIECPRSVGDAANTSPNPGRVIDALVSAPADIPSALRALSAAGLADAFIAARPIGALSTGERARLSLALAMRRAERAVADGRPPTVLFDDFADAIDDAAAHACAITLRRWLDARPRIRMVLATLRSSFVHSLRPDLLLDLGDTQRPMNAPPAIVQSEPPPAISRGTLADYRQLAHLHYRAGRPATIARILVARHRTDDPIAAMVVSMPTLNGAWRSLAWPGEYDGRSTSKRDIAQRINRDLRCISRLIVHPHHRARGLGAALVRAYLADPLTRRTESISAMGAASPIFTRAGMREWLPAPAPRDLRLLDALSAADLRPWMLADIDLALERIEQAPHLERSLRVWARAHGPTRPLAGAPPRDLIRAAAKHIIVPRRAYTHDCISKEPLA